LYYVTRPSDDAWCVSRCLAGDASAFERLVERYQRVLYSVAFRLTGDVEDARDIVQNAWLRAFERLETYDPGRPFFSWIYRIGVNESLNFRRLRRTHEPMTQAASAAVGEDPVARLDASLRIQRALMALEREHREVIVLKYFAELSYVEIGEAIGLPEKTVKSRLFEARQRLEAKLSGTREGRHD
jgi:RNA polymerase sigma-70 factor (ECF subfamily)